MDRVPRATIEVDGIRATLDLSRASRPGVMSLGDCWICPDPLLFEKLREVTRRVAAGLCGFPGQEVEEAAKKVAELLGGRVIEIVDCEVLPEDYDDEPGLIY
jgi:hypothetical protein